MIAEILFILVLAFAWAKMEIQIEGKDGWASKLPTWRVSDHWLLDLLYGSRPLTGYHVWAFVFVFLVLHMPMVAQQSWSWRWEIKVIALYNVFWVVEDFLWFVLNPHYGWSRFHKTEIWWHKRWLAGLPLDYWVLGLGAVVVIYLV